MTHELKKQLREMITEEIAALPNEYIASSDDGIFRRVTESREFVNAQRIMLYSNVGKEPATLKIAQAALFAGKTVAYPFCFRAGIMQARAVNNLSDLKPAILGIPAPPDTAVVIDPGDLDLIIVPAFAFDLRGYRLGYGGGYYDRFLHDLPVYNVGITRERLLRDELPIESHDVAVNCVVTEERTLITRHREQSI